MNYPFVIYFCYIFLLLYIFFFTFQNKINCMNGGVDWCVGLNVVKEEAMVFHMTYHGWITMRLFNFDLLLSVWWNAIAAINVIMIRKKPKNTKVIRIHRMHREIDCWKGHGNRFEWELDTRLTPTWVIVFSMFSLWL